MSIKVTGTLRNNGKVYEDPEIHLVPALEYKGVICLDAFIVKRNTTQSTIDYQSNETIERIDAITDNNIKYPKISDLHPVEVHVNPYTDFINSLESFVIQRLQELNPNCSFEKL